MQQQPALMLRLAVMAMISLTSWPQAPFTRPAGARVLVTSGGWVPNLDLVKAVAIPAGLAVPAGQTLQSAVRAEGHQHYKFNGTDWVLINATANLYNAAKSSDVVGHHFFLAKPDPQGGQPTWKTASGSAVTAKTLVAQTVDPDSITWNLLIATSHHGDSDGLLSQVTYVQRIQTTRGKPPSNTKGVKKGKVHKSKYHAIYAFYVQSS